ncbi:Glyoxalase-like domain protein [Pseudobythopirellula maris]|uniref:Glyoxalase-like domain protein n=1 Tax=Pseudobythopirellula maris TaxID=2527991 RepID=A0A5C5ZTK1_9BACT|nr:VOC family protein [Pseudobythopirellula maris]TWT90809.1 Glyoxalase-like domain protein [Pseudobythopirellula maris]
MTSPNPVNWFEIPAADLSRAVDFYEATLGVKLSIMELGAAKMAMFERDPEGHGAAGSLIQNEAYTPSHEGTLVYFHVDDIEATLARAEAAGGMTLRPKMAIGEHGFVGHFEDTEGNRVALHAMQ